MSDPTPNPLDLCVLDDVKDWLSEPLDKHQSDARLARLITAVSRDFLMAIGRLDLVPVSEYTELVQVDAHGMSRTPSAYEGTERLDRQRLSVQHWPIVEVTSVTRDDGTLIAASADGLAAGWYVDENSEPESRSKLQLIGSLPYFGRYRGTISYTVVYSAGYATVPEDIGQAIIDWVCYRYLGRAFIGQSSKSFGTETVQYGQYVMPTSTAAVASHYGPHEYF